MNKVEIIADIADSYTLDTRAVDPMYDHCSYLTSEGYRCALGRYSISPDLDEFDGDIDAALKELAFDDQKAFDALLKPEVRGHELLFWRDMQRLHDRKEFWDKRGPSRVGELYIDLLTRYWKDK